MEKDYKHIFDSVKSSMKCFDCIPVGIVIASSNGYFEYANKRYYEMTGISPQDVVGRKLSEIEEEGIYFKNSYAAKVLKEQKTIVTISLTNSIGEHKYGYVTSVPIFDKNHNIERVVTTIQDLYDVNNGYSMFLDAIRNTEMSDTKHASLYDGNGGSNMSDGFICDSKKMKDIRILAQKVCRTDATILITGESGSGKEALAEYIFSKSDRNDKPFVKINCTAIPENLIESELFGYEKGAFTGANPKGKKGLLESANGGTVLLDEIGDLPLYLQPKLLRVLQQGELFRVGSDVPVRLDVRFIAATNRNLEEKVARGEFRMDLYYRLKVIPFSMPPLRERTEDILHLTNRFTDVYCKKHNRFVIISDDVMGLLKSYSWPGNVRELQNMLEYLIVCTEDGHSVSYEMAKGLMLQQSQQPVAKNVRGAETYKIEGKSLFEKRDSFEKQVIEQSILETGSLRESATQLNIYISSLYRKIEKYNINADRLIARSKGYE